MKYKLTIYTKDVSYNLGNLEGSATELFEPNNWRRVEIDPVSEDNDVTSGR